MPRATIFALVLALCAGLVPAVGAAQGVALADAEAYHKGISREEVKRFRDLYEQSLRKAGAAITPAYGKRADTRGIEFVTSLSIGRTGDDFILTAQVSRIRLDGWASRAEARARTTDGAGISAAMDEIAAGVVTAVRAAPPRTTSQPPRKNREGRVRQDNPDPKAPMYGKSGPRESVDIESPSADDGAEDGPN